MVFLVKVVKAKKIVMIDTYTPFPKKQCLITLCAEAEGFEVI